MKTDEQQKFERELDEKLKKHLDSEMEKTADVDPKFRPHRDGRIRN